LALALADTGSILSDDYDVHLGDSPFVLNAVRRPEMWRRLGEIRWRVDGTESRRGLLERAAKDAGLALEIRADVDKAWLADSAGVRARSVRDALEQETWSGEAVIVMEPDRLVVMSYDAGVKFWAAAGIH
jgi:hypothetical protein